MSLLQEQLQSSLGDAFTIERELSGGGMSRVFVAVENRLRRAVVVKVLSPDLAAGVSAERFEREIQLAAQLQQANIVPLLSAGETHGLPYFTMPFVEGESLRTRLVHEGALPIAEAASILRDIARALSYAHSRGVVHRDIKPDNVLLSHGTAVVTDFGIAKALSASRTLPGESPLTQIGTSIGTPAYMSPEQVAGDPDIDHRADIYAFGCLAYELLTGHPPFPATTPQRALAAHLTERPTPLDEVRPQVPRALAHLVMGCLAKNPDERPQHADDILRSLDAMSTPSGAHPAGGVHERLTLRTRLWISAVSVLVVSVVGFGALRIGRSPARSTTIDKSITVLPLANLSGDRANDYFGEGLAEEITDALAKSGLRVVGRSSARSLSAKGLGATEIARQLGVGSVLQGTVQRSGEQVRISVSLASATDGTILWADKYDRRFVDVFAVQDEIAHSVARELQVTLTGGPATPLVTIETRDPEAHALYLQGLYLWNRRSGITIRQAIGLFESAVKRDPRYARAFGGLAMAYVVLPAYDDAASGDMLRSAMEAAQRALAIDSTIVEARTAIAYANTLAFQNHEAERQFAQAISLDSGFATAHFWHALLLTQQGLQNEALREIEKALSLEPASLIINTGRGQILYAKRDYTQAADALQRALKLDPTFQVALIDLARVLTEQGKSAEAIRILEQTRDTPGVRRSEKLGVLAYAYARAGRNNDARGIATHALSGRPPALSPSGPLATALYLLGERTKAIEILAAAVAGSDLWLAHSVAAAPYDALRKDPGAAAIFAKIEAR